MQTRSWVALCVLMAAGFGLASALQQPVAPNPVAVPLPTKASPVPRVLPGVLPDGRVQLPNQWRLSPVGKQLTVGDFPVNIAVHPSGQFLAVLHAGMREHEIMIVDVSRVAPRIVNRTVVDQTFQGVTFTPDGRKLFASGGEAEVVHEYDFARGMLSNPKIINLATLADGLIVGNLVIDAEGKDLFACGTWGDVVVRIPVENPDNRNVISIPKTLAQPMKEGPQGEPPSPPDGRKDPNAPAPKAKPKRVKGEDSTAEGTFPYACVVDAERGRLYVSLWATAQVAVVDLETNSVKAFWPTAEHPTEMVLGKDGKALYVACSNSTQVSVLEAGTGKPLQTIHCALYPQAPKGNTPSSLTLTPDGEMLIVANADANNLAVFSVANPRQAMPLGFIPTGWYPTAVRYNKSDKKIYVANGKGSFSKSNRNGPGPYRGGSASEYIGSLMTGTLSIIDLPTPATMAAHTKKAYANSPLQAANAVNLDQQIPADNPIPLKVGDASPIKHVIYVVKENRTYDQVFGDLAGTNAEPELCLFGEKVTPNLHKLVREFTILDNTYVEGEVSADGHEWSMGAYATDFVEKVWPLSYRGSIRNKLSYPSEAAMDVMARPVGGYLWDKAAEAKVTYRNYGEWVHNGAKKADGTYEDGKAGVPSLVGHFDPQFRGYDLTYPDVKRAERFVSEWKRLEKAGELPQLSILKLPNDHTAGTKIGSPTPMAMVAENDLAVGLLIEGISHTEAWKKTAIFIIEDDAQNGPDHVDAHRAEALVISPYVKRKHVDSTMYSTSSMLRTMELILGLQPMSQFDAAARPMYHSFTGTPDFTPYVHTPAIVDINKKNVAGAWGAEWSEKANLAKEDAADDLKFNEVIWKSVKGELSRMPAPVRSAFFVPKEASEDDDDD